MLSDRNFINIAKEIASASKCVSKQVGAVIVKDKRILTTGYNGAPTGITHCTEETCLRIKYNVPSGERHELCRGLHAEQNAIIQAAYHGVSLKGAKIYVTHKPCSICTKMLINSGIDTFIFRSYYEDSLADEMTAEAGIKIILMET